MANHKDNKFVLGNELVEVERGQFITSELKLMEKWGWSKSKVRSFLELLQNDEMIMKKSDRKKTTINIVNYSVYQDSETTDEPQKNHEETAKRPQKDTNKNDKKEKNEKTPTGSGALIDGYTDNSILKEALKEFIEMRRTIKKPLTDKALKMVFTKLDNLAKDESVKVEILNESILNCWQGVFPLKGNEHGQAVKPSIPSMEPIANDLGKWD